MSNKNTPKLICQDLTSLEKQALELYDKGIPRREILKSINRKSSYAIQTALGKRELLEDIAEKERESKKTWIGRFDWPLQTIAALEREGICFLEDIRDMTRRDLEAIDGLGKVGIEAIKNTY